MVFKYKVLHERLKESVPPAPARKSRIHSNLHTKKGIRNIDAGPIWLFK